MINQNVPSKKGESCSIKGKPLPGDPKKLDCCMQPEFKDGEGNIMVVLLTMLQEVPCNNSQMEK